MFSPSLWILCQSEQDQEESEGEDSAVVMDRLCKFIYAKDRTDRIRTCAILCHIYHHALHSRWYQARDLMLMSHLQDNIQHADPPVQVTFTSLSIHLADPFVQRDVLLRIRLQGQTVHGAIVF